MSEDIIAQIDRAVGCQQCAKKLREDGPSPDFCSEQCQGVWHAERADRLPPDVTEFVRPATITIELDNSTSRFLTPDQLATSHSERSWQGWLSRWADRIRGGQ